MWLSSSSLVKGLSCFLKSYVQCFPDVFPFVFLFLDVAKRKALRDLLKDNCEESFLRSCGKFMVLIPRVTLWFLLKSASDYLYLSGSQSHQQPHGSQMLNPYHLRNIVALLTLLPFSYIISRSKRFPRMNFRISICLLDQYCILVTLQRPSF